MKSFKGVPLDQIREFNPSATNSSAGQSNSSRAPASSQTFKGRRLQDIKQFKPSSQPHQPIASPRRPEVAAEAIEITPNQIDTQEVIEQPRNMAGVTRQEALDNRRNLIRGVSRGGEALVGLPGDIIQGAGTGIDWAARMLGGKGSEYLREVPFIPTSDSLRKHTTKLAEYFGGEGYLDPQSENEAMVDDFAQTAGSLLFPVGGGAKVGKAFATAGLGQLAKLAGREVGLPEWAQEGLKFGTMLGVGLYGAKGAKMVADEGHALRKAALSTTPKGHRLARNAVSRDTIDAIRKAAREGDLPSSLVKKSEGLFGPAITSVSGKAAKKAAKEAAKKGPELKGLIDFRSDLNANYPKATAGFRRVYTDIKDGLNKAFNSYGKQNAAFGANFNESTDMLRKSYSLGEIEKSAKGFLSSLGRGASSGGLGVGVGYLAKLLGTSNPLSVMLGLGAGVGSAALPQIQKLKVMNDHQGFAKTTLKLLERIANGKFGSAEKIVRNLENQAEKIVKSQ